MWVRLLDLVHRVEELPLPTVFAAHGLCLTAAFELSLGCDILLAAESARFGLVETVVGLTPAMGGTQRLAERAGPARARELVMTGELYDAATLERWNVVNRVLADDGFDSAARAFARKLAEGPTRAHAATKGIVRAYLDGVESAGRTSACPSSPETCSPPRTSSAPCGRFWSAAPVTPPTKAAEEEGPRVAQGRNERTQARCGGLPDAGSAHLPATRRATARLPRRLRRGRR